MSILASKPEKRVPYFAYINYTITCMLTKHIFIQIKFEDFISGQHIIEPRHDISNNVVCATSKASDQPAHSGSLIRVFVSRLNIV